MHQEVTDYNEIARRLRAAYDGSADERDQREKAPWKLAERHDFLRRLLSEGRVQLLEVGAGTGQDCLFFQENGLVVLATDLSPQMVVRCTAKGLNAREADLLNLGLSSGSFDAVYAMNCFLHIPNAELSNALAAIHHVLAPSGLFFLGTYGGDPFEGEAPDDWNDPPRFFSFRSDEQMLAFTSKYFDILDFHVVDPEDTHFQSFTLRRRDESPLRP